MRHNILRSNLRMIYGPSQTFASKLKKAPRWTCFYPHWLTRSNSSRKKGCHSEAETHVCRHLTGVDNRQRFSPPQSDRFRTLTQCLVRRHRHRRSQNIVSRKSRGSVFEKSATGAAAEIPIRLWRALPCGIWISSSKGEAEIGIVYRTDAVADNHVRIVDTAPAESHSPVRYGVAVVWTARNISGAGDFIEFMLSAPIQAQLKQYGFDQAVSDAGLVRRQEVKP